MYEIKSLGGFNAPTMVYNVLLRKYVFFHTGWCLSSRNFAIAEVVVLPAFVHAFSFLLRDTCPAFL